MIQIENLSLEEWYTCLKPYQKNIIEQLVAKYGEEKAAEEWLIARGPSQTATFGGEASSNTDNYWNRFRDEMDKLICGHPDYENEQKKFLTAGKTLGVGGITALSTWLSPIVCVSSSILVPSIILVLSTVSKMGINAYCSTKKFDN